MSPWVAFILGVLAGWLIEWLIDWIYWRRKMHQVERLATLSRQRQERLEQEADEQKRLAGEDFRQVENLKNALESLRLEHAALRSESEILRAESAACAAEKSELAAQLAAAQKTTRFSPHPVSPARLIPDDLEVIKGIGPVIAKKLNQAGILLFEHLAELTTEDLRRILGDSIQRLADEDDLIVQARQLAEQKNTAGKSDQ